MASFCMERLLFIKKFTLYFRRLNFFLWILLLFCCYSKCIARNRQYIRLKVARKVATKVFFCFFHTKSKQTAIQQSHIINPLLTSFARSVRESIPFGFYRTDLAPSSLGLYEKPQANTSPYRPVRPRTRLISP